jgi:hypothetical protein
MKLVATNLFAGFMIVFVFLTFERGARAQNVCGKIAGQVVGTIGSIVEKGGATSIVPQSGAKYSCSEIVAISYKGMRALLSDCKPGTPFQIVGDLVPAPGGKYVLVGDVISCR